MFKKAKKMNRLDREIMIAMLTSEQSIYSLEQTLKKRMKSNYTTVWRHIKNMQKDNLLTITKAPRKNGKLDKRKTQIPTLTPKGIATILIEGDLQEKELGAMNIFQDEFSKIPASARPFMIDIFCDALLEIKPKVNLKFFDEKYFRETYLNATIDASVRAIKKYRAKFEKEGIWATEKEMEEQAERLFRNALNGLKFSKKA